MGVGTLGLATSVALAGMLSVTACATAGAAPQQQQDEAIAPTTSLFMPATAAGVADRTGERNVMRSRLVEVDLAALAPAGDPAAGPERIALNLFDDAALVAVRERVEPAGAGFVWVGRVLGAQNGDVTLAVGDGVMMGNIRADEATYQVRFAGNGTHSVSQIDAAGYPPD